MAYVDARDFLASNLRVPKHRIESTISTKFESKVLKRFERSKPTPEDSLKAIRQKRVRRLNLMKRNASTVLSAQSINQLASLWSSYARTVLGRFDPARPDEGFYSVLLRLDLTGAILKVVQSRYAVSQVGVEGIVTLEQTGSFTIQDVEGRPHGKQPKVTKVMKRGTVFELTIPAGEARCLVHLYGDNLIHSPAERTTRKYKEKGSVGVPMAVARSRTIGTGW